MKKIIVVALLILAAVGTLVQRSAFTYSLGPLTLPTIVSNDDADRSAVARVIEGPVEVAKAFVAVVSTKKTQSQPTLLASALGGDVVLSPGMEAQLHAGLNAGITVLLTANAPPQPRALPGPILANAAR